MNYLFRNIFIFLLCVCPLFAAAQKIHLSCEKSVHNFGTIPENGGNVSHIFVLKNESKVPFHITSVVTSCGCTTSEYPKEAIAAGDTACIKISFNPKKRPGAFMKLIRVYGNNRSAPIAAAIPATLYTTAGTPTRCASGHNRMGTGKWQKQHQLDKKI